MDELLQQVSPRTRVAVIVAAFVLTGLAGYLYLLKPALADLAEIGKERHASLEPGEDARLQREIGELESHLEGLREVLYGESADTPAREVESQVIGALDRLSSEHDVALASVHPGQPSRVLMFDELPYEVEVVGRYRNLHTWLDAIESELRPLVVTQFDMRHARLQGDVHLRFRLVAYRNAGSRT